MKKYPKPRALKSRLLQSVAPALAALALAAHQGLQASHSSQPTSSDMPASVDALLAPVRTVSSQVPIKARVNANRMNPVASLGAGGGPEGSR